MYYALLRDDKVCHTIVECDAYAAATRLRGESGINYIEIDSFDETVLHAYYDNGEWIKRPIENANDYIWDKETHSFILDPQIAIMEEEQERLAAERAAEEEARMTGIIQAAVAQALAASSAATEAPTEE